MTYIIEWDGKAVRQLRKLDRPVQARILRAVSTLADNPRPPGAVRLQEASEELLRVRAGDWRVIYAIDDDHLVVLIVDVGHRREVYRRR